MLSCVFFLYRSPRQGKQHFLNKKATGSVPFLQSGGLELRTGQHGTGWPLTLLHTRPSWASAGPRRPGPHHPPQP